MTDAGTTRERIIAAARGWLGTPYHHQASLRGVGCDCLGLVRGVWRELYGGEPEQTPPYSPFWAQQGSGETLALAAQRHLVPLACRAARPATCCSSAGAPICRRRIAPS